MDFRIGGDCSGGRSIAGELLDEGLEGGGVRDVDFWPENSYQAVDRRQGLQSDILLLILLDMSAVVFGFSEGYTGVAVVFVESRFLHPHSNSRKGIGALEGLNRSV